MTVTGGSALNKDDIDRMVRDAEQYADADRITRENAETRNSADSLAYQTEKFIADNDDKIPDDIKTEVQEKLDELKKALEGNDIEAIKTAQSALSESSQKMGAAMYAANAQANPGEGDQGAPGADGQPAGDAPGDDDVVDAEIVDEEPPRTLRRRSDPAVRRWHARSRARHRSRRRGPVIRDRRRIDPETGKLRPQAAAPDPGTPAAPGAPAAGAPAAGAAGEPDEFTADGLASEEIDRLQKLADERTLDLQRLQAEYVNYRSRVDRDRAVASELATAKAVTELLPVLDDVSRAEQHGELTGGFKAVADSLVRSLDRMGVTRFGEVGDPFDPSIHEALMFTRSPTTSTDRPRPRSSSPVTGWATASCGRPGSR